jgi:hypothetical protein
MNETMSTTAKYALTAPHFTSIPHECQIWTREVYEFVYAEQFEKYRRSSARQTALAFKESPFYVPFPNGSTIGDLLYKTVGSGGDGHVGIRINGNRVAENSSVHVEDDAPDARGIRTLKEFGNFDVIVRLPPPTPQQIARVLQRLGAERIEQLTRV